MDSPPAPERNRPPSPPHEARRLAALRSYRILDTSPQRSYDDLSRLAAQLCGTPIGMISLIDENRQWFKSRMGIAIAETPRAAAFCAHAILGTDLMVVPDALEDPRFRDNPLVRGEERVRFYAGAPLLTTDRDAIGTLCVLDTVPRDLTPEQQDALRILSRQVMVQLELRRTLYELEETVERRRHAEAEEREQAQNLRALVQASPLAIMTLDPAGSVTMWNPAAERLFGWGEAEVLGRRNPIVPPEKADEFLEHLEVLLDGAAFAEKTVTRQRKDGLHIRVTLSAAPLLDDDGRIKGVMAVLGRLCGRQADPPSP
jgi:PAS domain S-box-containing protein